MKVAVKLVKLANLLDRKGLFTEANIIDRLIIAVYDSKIVEQFVVGEFRKKLLQKTSRDEVENWLKEQLRTDDRLLVKLNNEIVQKMLEIYDSFMSKVLDINSAIDRFVSLYMRDQKAGRWK